MSASDLLSFQAASDQSSVTEALRDALDAIAKQLAPAGTGPHGLVAMQWQAPDPASFHPSRHEVDLACREAFAGFTPPIELRKGEGGFKVTALARRLPPLSAQPVYRDYDRATLARQYSPRLQADFRTVCGDWLARSAAFTASQRALDLRYGAGRFETLDLFYPVSQKKPPLFVFFHGGYWQAMDKNLHSHFAKGFLDAGFAVAMVNYALAPQASLATILDQCRAALEFLARDADELSVDASQIHIAGHSAGGQIAAMLASDLDAPKICSALLLSGVFDLEPLSLIPMGPILGLQDPEVCRANSPLFRTPRDHVRIAIAVGGAESDEFIRQSQNLALQWKTAPAFILEGANHFTILDGLNGGPLLNWALAHQTN